MYKINTIIEPVITDKTAGMYESKKYTFLIKLDADKKIVQSAVESLYDVKVKKVNILNKKGKTKKDRKGRIGRRPNEKRAIVTLSEGDIDFSVK